MKDDCLFENIGGGNLSKGLVEGKLSEFGLKVLRNKEIKHQNEENKKREVFAGLVTRSLMIDPKQRPKSEQLYNLMQRGLESLNESCDIGRGTFAKVAK